MPLRPALGSPPRLSKVDAEVVAFNGGLDQETPDESITPGFARDALNFEVDSGGGYTRVGGTTRVITGQVPAWETPYLVARMTNLRRRDNGVALPDNFNSRTTLTTRVLRWGANSAAGLDSASTSGTLVAGIKDGAAWIVIFRMTQINATLGTYPPPAALENQGTDSSGQNDVRGVFGATGHTVATPAQLAWLRKEVAADRNRQASSNWVGGTSNRLHGSFYLGGSLWFVAVPAAAAANVLSPHPNNSPLARVFFSAGTGTTPLAGATVTQGAVSGTLHRAIARVGTWAASNAGGELLLTGVTGGTFGAGAITIVGHGTATGSATAVTLGTMPSPYQDVRSTYFSVATGTLGGRMAAYFSAAGAAGSAPTLFEFDGVACVPITGSPLVVAGQGNLVCLHSNRLWIAEGDRLVCSSVDNAHRFIASEGAVDIRFNGTITNLVSMVGAQDSAPLLVTTTEGVFMLYGTGAGPAPLYDWNLVPLAPRTPVARGTAQLVGQDVLMWSPPYGVMSLRSMQSFGNFEAGTVTRTMTPWVEPRRNKAIGSVSVLSRDQYRVFFSDGMALHVTIVGGQVRGAMPVRYAGPFQQWAPVEGAPINENEYPVLGGAFRHVQRGIDANGVERTIGCSGMQPVMLDQGGFFTDLGSTSEGGDPPPISAYLVMPFNFLKALTAQKTFSRGELQAETPGYFEIGTTNAVDRRQPAADVSVTARAFPDAALSRVSQLPTNLATDMRSGSVQFPLRGVGRSVSVRLNTLFGTAIQSTLPCWVPFRLTAVVLRYMRHGQSVRLR
jgi:hypothetical protein